jgi:HSP20 family molecular chaperone IbpA
VIELAIEVDPERAEATYEDGVLNVELPLRSRAAKRVPVQRVEQDGE